MSDEMKLLYALCKALGFEVEKKLDYAPRKENKVDAMRYNRWDTKDRCLAHTHGHLDIDENEEYTSLLVDPIVEYRLYKVDDA